MSIDYQGIANNLDNTRVMALLTNLQIPFEDEGEWLVMPTYCHNAIGTDASLKLYYYKNTHVFYCYSEDGSMSIFTFLKKFYTTQDIQYDWVKDIYLPVLDCAHMKDGGRSNFDITYRPIRGDYQDQKIRPIIPAIDISLLDNFHAHIYRPEWLNDHISAEAMDKFNIRYSSIQNKIIIPHYNVDGNLIGIRGRALNEWEIENVGKYMPVKIGSVWYTHPLSFNLYGLNQNKENIKQSKIAFICEAEKSVLQAESFDIPNCAVAVCGSKINKYHIELLVKYCQPNEIVICFDNEEKEKEHSYFDKLYEMASKYKNYCNMSFIYDSKQITNLKDSPFDRGQAVFETLLSERIKI